MKTIAITLLLIYQICLVIINLKVHNEDLQRQILLIVQLIPLAIAIILAM